MFHGHDAPAQLLFGLRPQRGAEVLPKRLLQRRFAPFGDGEVQQAQQFPHLIPMRQFGQAVGADKEVNLRQRAISRAQRRGRYQRCS